MLKKEKKALERELSTASNPSGSGRSNTTSKSNEAMLSLKQFRRLEQEKNILLKEKKALQKEKKALQKKLNNWPDVPILFHGHYEFGPDNVEDLSRLISMYLMDKPSGINRDQIYSCVRDCVDATHHHGWPKHGWQNNPMNYYVYLTMLLATCLGSNWFTTEQRNNIKQWDSWVRQLRLLSLC